MFRLLTFLGTSSGTPTPYRNVSSSCLSLADGRVWMFDCGEGTQHQLLRCKDVSVSKIEKVFLTHLHGDHCYGLPGMLCSMSLLWGAPGVIPNATYAVKKRDGKGAADDHDEHGAADEKFIFDHFSKNSEFLEIYGPLGTASFLREVLRSSETRFGFRYRVTEFLTAASTSAATSAGTSSSLPAPIRVTDHIELESSPSYKLLECEAPTRQFIAPTNGPDGVYYDLPAEVVDPHGGLSMKAAWLDHPVPSLGYTLVEPTMAGTLDMAKATALKVPKGPLLAKLKKGETVTFTTTTATAAGADGQSAAVEVTVKPEDVIGAPIEGRKLTMLGDTSNSDRMLPIADSSDWVVHEATFDDASSALALPRGHSTARMAGAFAKSLNAKKLIITHFSARYPPLEKDPQPIAMLRQQAVEGLEGLALDPSTNANNCAEETSAALTRMDDVMAAYDFLTLDLSRAAGGALKKHQQ